MREALDFLDECNTLATIVDKATDADLHIVTQFKNWTIEDVIAHLYLWNHAATLTLNAPEKFRELLTFVFARMTDGDSHPVMQKRWLEETHNGLHGKALVEAWRNHYPTTASLYENTDPNHRVAWAGPDMSAQSKIIARQMETWAHGQEIFDSLGLERSEADRIRNIAHLGVTTYSWTFRNRGETPPTPKPFVTLTAPSGAIWTWNDEQEDNRVDGNAVEFCQIVTQTRNVADTAIVTRGSAAEQWMGIAQCFAGAPNDPPAKGMRHKVNV